MGDVTLKSRQAVFQNSRLRIFKDHIVDGPHEVHDYLVVSPVSPRADLVAGVAVVPVCGNHVVLVRMFRHAIGRSALEVPRGFVDAGEDPRDAAVRELAEEASLECPVSRLVPMGYCTPEPGIIAARIALFAAPDSEPCSARSDAEPGRGEVVRLSRDEITRLLRAHLEDSTSALALHRWLMLG